MSYLFKSFSVLIGLCLNHKLVAEDVTQLGSVTITTSSDLLFRIVVVTGRQQMAKDESRDEHLLSLMLDYWDTFSVIPHFNFVCFWVDVNLNLVHLGVSLLVVCSVY